MFAVSIKSCPGVTLYFCRNVTPPPAINCVTVAFFCSRGGRERGRARETEVTLSAVLSWTGLLEGASEQDVVCYSSAGGEARLAEASLSCLLKDADPGGSCAAG